MKVHFQKLAHRLDGEKGQNMRYALYIDYRGTSRYEYRIMQAENKADAILEADAVFDPITMYLVKIMERTSRKHKVESGLWGQDYAAILERRETWKKECREHHTTHYTSKYGEWFA